VSERVGWTRDMKGRGLKGFAVHVTVKDKTPEVFMPVQKIKLSSSRVGYRWGQTGKVYTGKDARKKAQAQGKAVEARRKKAKR